MKLHQVTTLLVLAAIVAVQAVHGAASRDDAIANLASKEAEARVLRTQLATWSDLKANRVAELRWWNEKYREAWIPVNKEGYLEAPTQRAWETFIPLERDLSSLETIIRVADQQIAQITTRLSQLEPEIADARTALQNYNARPNEPQQSVITRPPQQGVTTRPPPQERCAQINSALIAASHAKDINRFRALVEQARIENCAFTQKAHNHLRNWEQQSQHSATQSQNQTPPRPPVQSPPQTDVRPPQQGVTTRPPQQGTSTGVKDAGSNQVVKPPCRCLKQVKYWFASDGRHNTCCPNPEQKRCIGTKCELKTKCLQWGPPGCVR